METVGQIRFYNNLVRIRKLALSIVQLTLEFEASFKDMEIPPQMRGVVMDVEISETQKAINELILHIAGCHTSNREFDLKLTPTDKRG